METEMVCFETPANTSSGVGLAEPWLALLESVKLVWPPSFPLFLSVSSFAEALLALLMAKPAPDEQMMEVEMMCKPVDMMLVMMKSPDLPPETDEAVDEVNQLQFVQVDDGGLQD